MRYEAMKSPTSILKRWGSVATLLLLVLVAVTNAHAATATTTTLTSPAASATYAAGASATLTATVSPSTATGTVTFKRGTTTLGTCTLSGGTCHSAFTTLPVGSDSLTAAYTATSTYAASTSSAVNVTVTSPTTTTLVTSTTSATVGSSVTLTANVAPAAATGTVTFKSGATALGTCTLSGGTCHSAFTTLAKGANALTAVYAGNGIYLTSTSPDPVVTMTAPVATTTTLKAGLTSAPATAITTAAYGASVTLTATISPSAAAGTVAFSYGSTTITGCGAVAASAGTATCATAALPLGANSLTAVFTPTNSASYNPSTSSASTVTVSQATTTATLAVGLTSAPTTAITTAAFGASVTLTATVTPSNAAGTVSFSSGSTVLGAGVAGATAGTWTLATTSLTLGSNSLTATFTPTTAADDTSSTSAAKTVTVTQATTTTTLKAGLTSAPATAITTAAYGASVTLTATVAPAATAGTVAFKYGTNTLACSPVTVSSGIATCATTALPLGANSLTAVFTPTTAADYTSSTSAASTVTVSQATTTTTLSAALTSAPSVVVTTAPSGASVTLTAALSPAAAIGTVTFKVGSTTLACSPVTVSSGTASCVTTALTTIGANSLTAVFTPTTAANDTASTSNTVSLTVTKPTTTTTLAVAAGPYYYGNSVTLTATTSPSAATGTVTFYDGSTSVGTCTLSSGTCGAATTATALSVGSNSLTAVYVGNSTYATSTSSATVATVVATPTAVSVVASATVITASTPFNLTATVTPHAGTATVTAGSVTFYDSSTLLGKATVNSSGVATLTGISTLTTLGKHYLIASYGGVYSASVAEFTTSLSSSAQVTVGTTQTISHWYNQSTIYGTPVTFAATSTSGGAVVYSVISGPGTINGSVLTPSGAGAIVVGATVPATGSYTAITTPVQVTVTAYPASLAITASNPTAIVFGQAAPAVTASYSAFANGDTSASLAVRPTCFVPNYTTASAPGSFPTVCYGAVDPNYDITYTSGSLTVNKAPAVVSAWPTTSGSIVYGAALSTSALTGGTANTPGTFAWTTASTIPHVGGAPQSVTFTPTSSTDYTTVAGTASITVTQATPTISTPPTASAVGYNSALSTSKLSGGSTTAIGGGVFSWTSGSTTLTTIGVNAGQGVTFTPTDATDYTTATTTVSVTVSKATATITWPTATAITYGQALSNSTLSGGTSTPGGAFAWANPSAIPAAGSSVSESVTFTPTDTTHYSTTTGAVHLAVNPKTATVNTWPTATTITYGAALSTSTLRGGSATTAGTFAWTSPTTIPNAGSAVSESVTFTPTNVTEYSAATSNINITVNQAAATVDTWPTATGISSGSQLSSSTLNGGTASVAGSFGWTSSTTVPAVGTASYNVTFTPTDAIDYTTVSTGWASVTVNACGLQDTANTAFSTALDIYVATGSSSTLVDPSLDAEGSNVGAICAVTGSPSDGTAVVVTYPYITSNAAGSYAADSNANGTNAAVLAYGTVATAGTGAAITINDDGSGDPSSISTANNYNSAVFASMGGTVSITDASINTYGNNSYALDATNAGTLNLNTVTATTYGNNSAVIMSGVGGANAVTSTGGNYTSNGTNAAGVYAAGNGSTISLTGDNVTANNWTAVVVEGGNSVAITGGASLTGALGNNHGIFFYEGSSGDATAGTGNFTMTNGSIAYNCDASAVTACATGVTASNQNALATLFSVANTTAIVTLTDVAVTNGTNASNNGILLTAAALNSGTTGSNGGNVTFNAIGETLIGDVIVDSISTASLNLAADSSQVPSMLTGSINTANSGAATVSLTLDATSSWVVGNGPSYLTSLTNAGSGNITCQNSGQCSVYVGGTLLQGIN